MHIIMTMILVLLSFSCGKKAEDQTSPAPGYEYTYLDPEQEETIQNPSGGIGENNAFNKNITISCKAENCPQYTALILAKHNNRSLHCTGTLIEQEFILTNSHCLPSYREGQNCDDISVYFRTPSGATTKADCGLIVKMNSLSDIVPDNANDYALFKLKSRVENIKGLDPKEIESISDQAKVKIYSINLVGTSAQGKIKAEIVRYDCTYQANSYFTHGAENHYYPLMALKNCPIVGGNSGSAIFGPYGGLAGVVYAGHKDNKNSFQTSAPFGLGVSALCFNDDQYDLFNDLRCVDQYYDYSSARVQAARRYSRQLSKRKQERLDRELNNSDRYIQYQDGQPQCIKLKTGTYYKRYDNSYYLLDLIPVLNDELQLGDHLDNNAITGVNATLIYKTFYSPQYTVYIKQYRGSEEPPKVSMISYDQRYKLDLCQ
jgi:V8-like Glu-specific endopeptidase